MRDCSGFAVNGKQVGCGHIVQHNELIANRMHRHEPPVTSRGIDIVFQDENVVVVDKPGSIPVHPSGRYRHNTVLGILGRESNLPDLSPCHRLDRLTSGLLILSKNKATTETVSTQIQDRTVQKEYICRVRGLFPTEMVTCEASIKTQNYKVQPADVSLTAHYGVILCVCVHAHTCLRIIFWARLHAFHSLRRANRHTIAQNILV